MNALNFLFVVAVSWRLLVIWRVGKMIQDVLDDVFALLTEYLRSLLDKELHYAVKSNMMSPKAPHQEYSLHMLNVAILLSTENSCQAWCVAG